MPPAMDVNTMEGQVIEAAAVIYAPATSSATRKVAQKFLEGVEKSVCVL